MTLRAELASSNEPLAALRRGRTPALTPDQTLKLQSDLRAVTAEGRRIPYGWIRDQARRLNVADKSIRRALGRHVGVKKSTGPLLSAEQCADLCRMYREVTQGGARRPPIGGTKAQAIRLGVSAPTIYAALEVHTRSNPRVDSAAAQRFLSLKAPAYMPSRDRPSVTLLIVANPRPRREFGKYGGGEGSYE